MNDSTQIKYEKVSNACQKINLNKGKIQGILDEFTQEMNTATSEGVLQGVAAESLIEKYSELKRKFDSYISTINDFVEMISMAKDETKSLEQNIQNVADEMIS